MLKTAQHAAGVRLLTDNVGPTVDLNTHSQLMGLRVLQGWRNYTDDAGCLRRRGGVLDLSDGCPNHPGPNVWIGGVESGWPPWQGKVPLTRAD